MRAEPRLVHSGSFLGGPAHSAGLGGRLAVDPDGCVYAEIGAGEALGLAWPNDYSARLGSDQRVEILNLSGDVVLREGQLFRAAGDSGRTSEHRGTRSTNVKTTAGMSSASRPRSSL